jgi:outer membrane protein OmpA-like peptidoglycan-associated protein
MLACSLAAAVGCVSKTYVRNQLTPIIEKVNQLDDQTAKNTNEIKTVDARSDQAIEELNARTEEALARAKNAGTSSTAAQGRSDEALGRADKIVTQVYSLDNYKLVSQIAVRFASSVGTLDDAAMKTLDNLGAQAATRRDAVVTVEGATDSTGNPDSNYDLSSRRAEAVRIYLATRYGLPAFKIHVIGLGSDKPASTNRTSAGRAENRRADVQLFAVENKLVSAPSGEADSTADDESDSARARFPSR